MVPGFRVLELLGAMFMYVNEAFMMKLDQVAPRELVQCPVAAHSRIDLGAFCFLFSVEDLSAFLFERRLQLRAMNHGESYSISNIEVALGEIRRGTNLFPYSKEGQFGFLEERHRKVRTKKHGEIRCFSMKLCVANSVETKVPYARSWTW
uniref:Uncharacterized protein n=1 Tax=Spumella elongata TaxID=89044 RepID=A0A7S3HBA1_9STRA|mmetsp:Transcript_43604/g.75843  ORF Transcript_43604/g.75843 Transcript_43604/m.75843 type:complete len:150 (+) Transcript_43604:2-451(+)